MRISFFFPYSSLSSATILSTAYRISSELSNNFLGSIILYSPMSQIKNDNGISLYVWKKLNLTKKPQEKMFGVLIYD